MISIPEQTVWSLADLKKADLGQAAIWATLSVRSLVAKEFPAIPVLEPLQPLPANLQTLIVVGGGGLLDESKAWIHDNNLSLKLIAVASIWGSGAEASPIIVQNRNGQKVIRMDSKFLPTVRVVWPELAKSIPEWRGREALGDCWAHALEGFAAPIASEKTRQEIAELIREMLMLPLGNHPAWFDLGARASAAQARSSVGLVHGIAHTLEGPLMAAQPKEHWGHAKLCGVYLYPVTQFNFKQNPAYVELLKRFGIDVDAVLRITKDLYSDDAYGKALPLLQALWMQVLRDRCTRTNPVLVRPPHLEYFTSKAFL